MRLDVPRIEGHFAIEFRVGIALQRAPVDDCVVPFAALGREAAAAQVLDRRFVDRHHAGARARLDRHVADRHAAFHRQRADRAAGEFDRVAGTAGGADAADDRKDDVLCRHAARQRAFDVDAHVLHLLGHQALRGEHVLDLGSADTVREAGESAMRAGVGIAAHHGHARQRRALLRTDDMDDALALVEVRKVDLGAEFLDVGVERLDLQARERIAHAGEAFVPVGGRRVVIGGRDYRFGAPGLAPRLAQSLVGLRARHFMDEVPIDVEQRRAVVLGVDDVAVPKLVVKGLRHLRFPHCGNLRLCHLTITCRQLRARLLPPDRGAAPSAHPA